MRQFSRQRRHTTLTSELKGSLNDTQLDGLLTLLGSTRKTGVLRLYYPDEIRNTALALRRGKIGRVKTVFAPKLTDIMIDKGASRQNIEALRRSQQSKNSQGATVISSDSGIDYGIVIQALRRRIEMALVPLLLYESVGGRFAFTAKSEDDALDSIFIEPGIEADHVTLEIAKKVDELYNCHPSANILQPLDRVVVSAQRAELSLHMHTFSRHEWLLLTSLFEQQSLIQLALSTRLVWDELLKSVIDLVDRGFISTVPY